MERQIRIVTKAAGTVEVALTSENPQTVERIWAALPIRGNANRWGDEIYFSIPVSVEEENSRADVEVGAVAYWPPGSALCIFFGRTPASRSEKPRAASPVNVFAKVKGDATVFRNVRDGDTVSIEKNPP
jgi:hypothetical protein